jgi:fumarylpyruvate hydrolase
MTTADPSSPTYVFEPPPIPTLPVKDADNKLFPIHRVYCVGKNYADHVKEMGGDVTRSKPVFFTKPGDGVILASNTNATPIAYPPHTTNLHYECELVVAIGKTAKNGKISLEDAPSYIFGFAVGLDLTRRDLQSQAKASGAPWDTAKYFDQSAPMGSIRTMTTLAEMEQYHLQLRVNDELKQSAPLTEMIWSIPEIIAELSSYYQLQAGDLIMTGTPSGVGPVQVGDRIVGQIVRDGGAGNASTENVVEPVDIVLVE